MTDHSQTKTIETHTEMLKGSRTKKSVTISRFRAISEKFQALVLIQKDFRTNCEVISKISESEKN